jgi:hypothetical protein
VAGWVFCGKNPLLDVAEKQQRLAGDVSYNHHPA